MPETRIRGNAVNVACVCTCERKNKGDEVLQDKGERRCGARARQGRKGRWGRRSDHAEHVALDCGGEMISVGRIVWTHSLIPPASTGDAPRRRGGPATHRLAPVPQAAHSPMSPAHSRPDHRSAPLVGAGTLPPGLWASAPQACRSEVARGLTPSAWGPARCGVSQGQASRSTGRTAAVTGPSRAVLGVAAALRVSGADEAAGTGVVGALTAGAAADLPHKKLRNRVRSIVGRAEVEVRSRGTFRRARLS